MMNMTIFNVTIVNNNNVTIANNTMMNSIKNIPQVYKNMMLTSWMNK